MKYHQLREEILQYLNTLQKKGFSYQAICDYINSQYLGFELFKDFFSRLQSKPNHYRSVSKQEKLSLIHHHVQDLFYQNVEEGDFTNDILSNLISSAATAKFEAFLNIDRFENTFKDRLAEFYLEKSPAYLDIENNLNHKKQYGWELDIQNHGSRFEILSIETDSLFTQSAVLTTKEFWKLSWVDKTSRMLQFKYETLGDITYLLSKDREGKWKIIENMIKTPVNRLEPAYIDYALLTQLSSSKREENKLVLAKFLSNNDILHGIAFMKTVFADKLQRNHLSILNRIKESCLHSHRLLNIGAINFATFKAEIELLNVQAKLVCDSIFLTVK